jgi:integrase
MPRRRGRRGDGGLTRRPNGRWQAQWSATEGGKRVRKSETFDQKSEAEWWLREAKRGTIPDVDVTLSEYLDRWLAGKRSIRPSTRALYAIHIRKHIAPALGDFGITELQPRHVERFVTELEQTVSPGTAGLILRTLRAALSAGVRRHELPDNPASDVEAPTVTRPPVEAMTDEEADKIIEVVTGTWIEHVTRFLIGSGCRIGEACALDQRDVMDGYVRLRAPKTVPRTALVSEDGMAALNEAIRQAPRVGPKEPVFFGPHTGDRITRHPVTQALATILVAHGLPRLTCHSLRHGAATRMLSQGHSIKTIADQLGNSPRLIASTYAHVAPSVARSAVASLDRKRKA